MCGDGNSVGLGRDAVETTVSDVVLRYCAPKESQTEKKCKLESETNVQVRRLHIKEGRGKACTCTGALCNSAPAASVGHLTVGFIGVASLLAATSARLLGQ